MVDASWENDEKVNGIRLAWNLWPHIGISTLQNRTSAQIATQMITGGTETLGIMSSSNSFANAAASGKLPLPISLLYSPAKQLASGPLELGSQPQICGNSDCRAILNPFWYFFKGNLSFFY